MLEEGAEYQVDASTGKLELQFEGHFATRFAQLDKGPVSRKLSERAGDESDVHLFADDRSISSSEVATHRAAVQLQSRLDNITVAKVNPSVITPR